MSDLVQYSRSDAVGTIAMDDGKVNALSPQMLAELNEALDSAEADGVVVILTGRSGVFSAGFDLSVLRDGGSKGLDMLRSGFSLAGRLLGFPSPVLIACSGHAVAMGSFLLLSADYRIGVDGPFRVNANEVAIGLTMPFAAIHLCRARLTPAEFSRAVTLAHVYSPSEAVAAGFLDEVVAPEDLNSSARVVADGLSKLDRCAHVATKRRVRHDLLEALRASIEAELADPD